MIALTTDLKSKIITLEKVKDLTNNDDIWELQTLIATYQMLISYLENEQEIDISKVIAYIESFEEKFEYFLNID